MTEVEKAFIAVQKIIEKKIDENPKGGIIVNKGKDNEVKIKYKDLLRIVNSISYHVLKRKQIYSRGICKTCEHFDSTGYTENHGKCTLISTKEHPITNYGRCMGIYDNCAYSTYKSE